MDGDINRTETNNIRQRWTQPKTAKRKTSLIVVASLRFVRATEDLRTDPHPSWHSYTRKKRGSDIEDRHLTTTETYLGWTYHDLSRIRCRPNFSVTSAGDIATEGTHISHRRIKATSDGANTPQLEGVGGGAEARERGEARWQRRGKGGKRGKGHDNIPPGRSCLLANTRSKQSFISLSLKILCNSCFASSTLSRS